MNVPGAYSLIQLEEVVFDAPNAGRLFNRIAAVVNNALAIASVSALGTQEISLLTEAQFQSQKGAGWVLMDGRNVVGSAYAALFGTTVVPDFRGLFLRGKNNGSGNDPSGETATGFTQLANDNQSHGHSGTLAIDQTGVVGTMVFTFYGFLINSGGASGGQRHGGAYFEVAPSPQQFTIFGAGGNEARGRNITVNYFIKIN